MALELWNFHGNTYLKPITDEATDLSVYVWMPLDLLILQTYATIPFDLIIVSLSLVAHRQVIATKSSSHKINLMTKFAAKITLITYRLFFLLKFTMLRG